METPGSWKGLPIFDSKRADTETSEKNNKRCTIGNQHLQTEIQQLHIEQDTLQKSAASSIH